MVVQKTVSGWIQEATGAVVLEKGEGRTLLLCLVTGSKIALIGKDCLGAGHYNAVVTDCWGTKRAVLETNLWRFEEKILDRIVA